MGDRRQFSVHRTRSLPNQLRHGWECMLRKIGSSLMHQPSTQYPCTSPQSLHEMNRRFGELKLALGVIGLPVTARDRILRCSPPVVGTTRAGPRFRKVKGQKVVIGGYEFPISLGAENESTSRFDNTFFFLVGKERRSPSEPSNEE